MHTMCPTFVTMFTHATLVGSTPVGAHLHGPHCVLMTNHGARRGKTTLPTHQAHWFLFWTDLIPQSSIQQKYYQSLTGPRLRFPSETAPHAETRTCGHYRVVRSGSSGSAGHVSAFPAHKAGPTKIGRYLGDGTGWLWTSVY